MFDDEHGVTTEPRRARAVQWSSGCTPHDEAFAYDPAKDTRRSIPAPPGAPVITYTNGLSIDGEWVLFRSALSKVAGSTLDGAVHDPVTNGSSFGAAPVAGVTEA